MELDDEEEKMYRELELKYDKLYKEIYHQRHQLLQGKIQPPADLIADYDLRAKELDDEDFKKIEVNPCDVKEIQNTPLGVPGFWLRAMLNHPGISRLIQEKDRPIIMHLQDVNCELHTEGYGFDLIFTFEKNDYFTNESLKKSFVMTKQNVIEKCQGSEISWKEGKNVTQKKIKKKSKNKKAAGSKTVVKTVEQESFFNFFKTIEMPDEKTLAEPKEPVGDEEEKDVGQQMDEDFDTGNDFKDQIIPLALEYYLEVIEPEEEDEEGCCGDSDEDGHHHHHGKGGDSDEEDEKPAKGKKNKKGGKDAAGAGAGAAGAGAAGQQECKQQ